MTLLERLAADRLKYRKIAKESLENQLYSTALTTLYGEVVRVGKDDGNRDTTDEEATIVIQKFIKGLNEIEKYEKLSVSAILERDLYQRYLPQELSELLIEGFINGTYQDEQITMKDMKGVLVQLKAAFPSYIINGKAVSNVIKRFMSA